MEKINEMVRPQFNVGRPLRSIFAIFDKKLLSFKFHHITTTNNIKIEHDLLQKKKNYKIIQGI